MSVTVAPPALRSLPSVSLDWTVIAEVAVSVVRVTGLAEMIVLAPLGIVPATK